MLPVIRQHTTFVVAAGELETLINATYQPVQPLYCTEHPQIGLHGSQDAVIVTDRPGAVGRRSAADIAAWQAGRLTAGRGRHPKLTALLNDLCSRGLLDAGEYRIVVSDTDRQAQRDRWSARIVQQRAAAGVG
jgi:hypothetical protein